MIKKAAEPYDIAMEHFTAAKTIRLRNAHGKYLWADEDATSVSQERDCSSSMTVWEVELVDPVEEGEPPFAIRLRSYLGTYLTASSEPFLLGMTGRKVVQSNREDSTVEWEPVSDHGGLIKLKTPHGNYLRANHGLPPWRNSVTHDVPVRTATQSWVLWQVELVEALVPQRESQNLSATLASRPKLEMQLSFKIPKSDGRLISYSLMDGGRVGIGESDEWPSFHFKGHSVSELAACIKQELGIEQEIVVCTRHAASGKLFPLQLGLPPNNAPMHLVVVLKDDAKSAESLSL